MSKGLKQAAEVEHNTRVKILQNFISSRDGVVKSHKKKQDRDNNKEVDYTLLENESKKERQEDYPTCVYLLYMSQCKMVFMPFFCCHRSVLGLLGLFIIVLF